jgi:hypothetical protein
MARSCLATASQDAQAGPQIVSRVVGWRKPSWRHHDRAAGGCTPSCLPHAVPGEAWQHQKQVCRSPQRRQPSAAAVAGLHARNARGPVGCFSATLAFCAGAAGALAIVPSKSPVEAERYAGCTSCGIGSAAPPACRSRSRCDRGTCAIACTKRYGHAICRCRDRTRWMCRTLCLDSGGVIGGAT